MTILNLLILNFVLWFALVPRIYSGKTIQKGLIDPDIFNRILTKRLSDKVAVVIKMVLTVAIIDLVQRYPKLSGLLLLLIVYGLYVSAVSVFNMKRGNSKTDIVDLS